MKNKLKGFTLTELIVVIAIIGVLCGVLVPNGIAWIRNSKLKTCNSEAKTVFNTAVTVLQDYQLEGRVSTIVSTDGQQDFEKGSSGSIEEVCEKITNKLGTNFGENSVWFVRTNVQNYNDRNSNAIKVVSALFADNSNSVCIGRYPVPANRYSISGDYDSVKGTISSPPNDPTADDDAIYDHSKN